MVRSSVLLCFRPFSITGRDVCPLSAQDARAFYSFLSQDLWRLEQSLAEGSVSLRWSAEAMTFLKKMQIELLSLFKKCRLPIAFDAEEDWFDQYMQETAALLDFCNSLKSAISGINRYRMVVDLAVQNIVEGGPACMISLEEIEASSSTTKMAATTDVVSVGRKIDFGHTPKTDRTVAAVMLAAKCAMAVVSVLLVSAIVSPLAIETGSEELVAGFPQLEPFAGMLTSLVLRFHERAARTRSGPPWPVLAEPEMVDAVIGELKARVQQGETDHKKELLVSAELLRTSSDELREGIEVFDAVVDEVFEVVVRGRNEMLDAFRDRALSAG